jgi:tRNA threonylcarbamoyladenosine biosynthesis protein TsaE
MNRIIKFKSFSVADTKKVGRALGRRLKLKDVVTLRGELGAGKTTLVKGIAKGLGVRSEKEVASPTFVLIHEYRGRFPIYHLDWYRLARVEGPDEALAQECFDAEAVTLIEWPQRGKAVLPRERIEVKIFHSGPSSRSIEVYASGKKYRDFYL